MKTCDYGECDRPHRAKGYCNIHYARIARHGSPETPGREDPLKRLQSQVVVVGDCMLWQGGLDTNGYGRFYDGERTRQAHRFNYERHHGTVRRDLEVDHLCRVRHCVNLEHLEPVSGQENCIRGHQARAGLRQLCAREHFLDMTADKASGECLACVDLDSRPGRRSWFLTDTQIGLVRSLLGEGLSQREVHRRTGISRARIAKEAA